MIALSGSGLNQQFGYRGNWNLDLQQIMYKTFEETSMAIYYQQFRLYYCEQTD